MVEINLPPGTDKKLISLLLVALIVAVAAFVLLQLAAGSYIIYSEVR